ncbi:MAG: ankyrin repeat domain-containing protein [Phycisphaerae bacterium]|nr:ankyrin repeat domain-containing protein [Phycisphaerae bacterium]NUQ44821.1 ankyrin repeat domain-containing protein [Phycisphaerae bacterium]
MARHAASTKELVENAKWAVRTQGADVNVRSLMTGDTALHEAAGLGDATLVNALLDLGAKIDALNYSDKSALHEAAAHGNTDAAKALLDRGAPVNQGVDEHRSTPLHMASMGGHVDTATLLLDRGADVNAESAGLAALHDAAAAGNSDMVSLLLKRGANAHAVATEERMTAEDFARAGGHAQLAEFIRGWRSDSPARGR